ncbi:MAG: diacylglycerol kinase [Neisseria sp.]|uniref:diacylglycerol kinase n=1 Tax=Neisseria sp. TaxID=192066 RepID=UPI0026DC19B7|nr:diacylglycerol kinase [Neisseria sp.]MDO4640762.1 diacylglycerol kinase [Neisseria sp.]
MEKPVQKPSYAEEVKGKTGIRRMLNATRYSISGFAAAMEEQGFRQLVYLNAALFALLIFLPFGPATRMMLFMASCITLIIELLNTGLEAAVDHTSLAQHPLAKRAKDVGSAAQCMALLMLVGLWAMALWREYGLNLF